ncbi:MAG: hypothetical protein IJR72_01880 [Oscillospiraceae bacterium]|nr:hypothetical protein [Oscillospiraceae bacterium]
MKTRLQTRRGWRHYWLAMGLLCAVTLALPLGARLVFRRTAHITLPDSIGLTGAGNGDGAGGLTAAVPLDVTPDTAQAVIATLSRRPRYRRTVTVRRTWSGGEQDTPLVVTVSGDWTRVDRTLPDGTTRHAVTDNVTTYLWYGDAGTIVTVPAGAVSADNEQLIPTYEDVLRLPKERIALADYHRIESGIDCIYVETTQEDSRKERYWIGVSTGLLVAAEMLLDDNSIYWMEAAEPEEPPPDAFTLPDGTVLSS